ncbi:CbtB-domain containing protein [Albimonas sp. CAU 1670]|uniref:CbtB domain-containing protein n=1 Tax=Albimonas sp. CAU 1670 TaxID=3032599 RepID=UPI0023D9D652|nr:CbtB domain-containing protein [Albimonas sp. CAU 1670]MDF2234201.1 CbtB-domain containing protein [Albimonas sp. CAU 1670]
MTTASKSSSRVLDRELLAVAFALVAGAFLVFGAGFANSATLHDAGHDSRHSLSFPCH